MVAYRLHGGLLVALGALQTLAIPTIKSEEVQLHERSSHLLPRSYTIDCKRKQDDLDLIKTELTNAAKMATYASENLGNDGQPKTYREAFISKDLLDIPNNAIVNQLKDSYGRGAKVNDDSSKDYPLTVTCDNSNVAFCQKGYYAHMNDGKKTLNLCDAWFDVTGTKATLQLQTTKDILAGCTGDSPKYKNLEDFWAGKAQALLHEWTHTTYFTGTKEKTIDYAYGVKNCLNLAYGSRRMPAGRDKKKDGTPICPDPNDDTKPGICDKNFSIDNADTLAILAGGIWFSDKAQCNNAIPIGLKPDEPTADPGGVHTPVDDPENPDGPADDPTQTSSSSSASTAAVASATSGPPPPPPSSTAPPPPPPSSTAPPPPPPSPTVVPCKSGGMFSDGCGDSCGTNGKCVSGSAGYPTPQLYYTCEC